MSQFFKKTLTAAAIVAALGSGTAFGQDPKAAKPAAAPAAAAPASTVKADKHNVSYMVGMDVGKSLSTIKDEIDLAVVYQAMQAAINGGKAELSAEDAQAVRQEFMQKLQAKRAAEE